jgi:hypothetical protein
MIAELPADQAADDAEFMARLGQFALISPAERAVVLAARTAAVTRRLAHYRAMRELAAEHGERWGVLATEELVHRDERELAWLAELADLAAQ